MLWSDVLHADKCILYTCFPRFNASKAVHDSDWGGAFNRNVHRLLSDSADRVLQKANLHLLVRQSLVLMHDKMMYNTNLHGLC